jgi:ParB/RepB/Spo0J family partition protein
VKAADIPVTQIRSHPDNPRRHAVADDELVDSIRVAGVLQAVTVAPAAESPSQDPADPESIWVLLAGHRRTDAAQRAGAVTIPAVIRDDLLTDAEQLEAMLIENLHREDLTAVEEAHAYEQLQLFGMTAAKIAKATGRSLKTVKSRLDLIALPEGTQQRLHDGQLRLDQAATLLEFQAGAPDIAAELEENVGRKDWDYLVTTAKQKLERRQHNAAKVAEFHAAGAVELDDTDTNWLPLYRFPEALQDTDQHPDCLGYRDYGQDSYSAPVLLCRDTDKHDLPKSTSPGSSNPVVTSGNNGAERAQREAEYEERQAAEAEKRAKKAAATEARLRWLHTFTRTAMSKPKDRASLLERLLPMLMVGIPAEGDAPDRTELVASFLIARGGEPGEMLATNIVSSNAHQAAEAEVAATVGKITGPTLIESTYAAWLTAWIDWALTADMAWAYEQGHTTILRDQLDLWSHITDHGFALSDVDEQTVATITSVALQYADDESSEAGQ